jgi:hypothetical protein
MNDTARLQQSFQSRHFFSRRHSDRR